MEMHSGTTDDSRLNRFLITPILIIASLYSLYLVIHPYTPLSKLSLSILDLTQVQRATHVFFLLVAGYLLSSSTKREKAGVGSYIFAVMACFPLYAFWKIGLDVKFSICASAFWIAAIVPALYPPPVSGWTSWPLCWSLLLICIR